MRAKINGTDFLIQVAGREDKPALILNHSLASSHEMWGLQIALFARHFRVVAFDMRGHGASTPTAGEYTMDQLADDVVGIADHLGLKRFNFLGLSIGGMVGQNLGFRHGARLEKLVLSSTGTGTPGVDAGDMWDSRIALARQQGMASQVEDAISRWLSADFRKAAPLTTQWIRDLIAATPVDGFAGCAAAIKTMSLPPEKLVTIKTPTFVIAGEEDVSAPPSEAAKIVAAVPGAKSFILPRGYHLSNIEFPHQFNEQVLGFLLGRDHG